MEIILLVVLLILLFGSLPSWPDNNGWGYRWNYYPSAGLGVAVFILAAKIILQRL